LVFGRKVTSLPPYGIDEEIIRNYIESQEAESFKGKRGLKYGIPIA
jgi:hypothetical protein